MFVGCLLQDCRNVDSVWMNLKQAGPKGPCQRLLTITVLWRHSGHSCVRLTHIDLPPLVQIGTLASSKPRWENSPWRMTRTSLQDASPGR
jgi:hypothetical protein